VQPTEVVTLVFQHFPETPPGTLSVPSAPLVGNPMGEFLSDLSWRLGTAFRLAKLGRCSCSIRRLGPGFAPFCRLTLSVL
jgi:hypothetical protein